MRMMLHTLAFDVNLSHQQNDVKSKCSQVEVLLVYRLSCCYEYLESPKKGAQGGPKSDGEGGLRKDGQGGLSHWLGLSGTAQPPSCRCHQRLSNPEPVGLRIAAGAAAAKLPMLTMAAARCAGFAPAPVPDPDPELDPVRGCVAGSDSVAAGLAAELAPFSSPSVD